MLIFSLVTLVLGIAYNLGHIKIPWLEGVALIFFLCLSYFLKIIPEIVINNENERLRSHQQTHFECVVWRDN